MIDNKEELLALLAIKIGVNLQKDQMLLITCDVACSKMAKVVSKIAYQNGAKRVFIKYSDEFASKINYEYADTNTLCEVPNHIIEEFSYYKDNNVARLLIKTSYPNLLSDLDSNKISEVSRNYQKSISFYQEFVSGNGVQWTIISYPNIEWAKKVFPNLSEKEALDSLWDSILSCSRVDENVLENWEKHIINLDNYNKKLNSYNFKELHFKNKKGTDLTVGLVKNHIWAGGAEYTVDNIRFAPNIPSEEVFTMPLKTNVNGKVYATKPLEYQGKTINNFNLTFKDGKVVSYNAEQGIDALKSLIELDEGSSYLGEVALVSHSSPISKSNILFHDTLFDENASCHLALGRAYPMNVLNGLNMTKEELSKIGSNYSLTHVDFMFGSSDMSIDGITYDGKTIKVFENGDFII